MFPPMPWGGRWLRPQPFFKSLCLCRYLYLCVRYLVCLAVYLCYNSVKISVSVIYYLCV